MTSHSVCKCACVCACVQRMRPYKLSWTSPPTSGQVTGGGAEGRVGAAAAADRAAQEE